MRRTTIIALTLLTCLGTTLAACGRDDTDTSDTATTGPVGSGPATGTVTVWAQGAEAEKLPELLKEFKAANPDVTVNVTAVPWSAAHNKYQTALAGGEVPDIGQLGTTWMGEFAGTGGLATTPSDVSVEGFYPGATTSTKVGGGSYGVPWYVDTPVLYYRTDLARQAGYDHPPATWEEFKAMAKAMQAKAGAKYGVSLPPKDFQAFLPFAWSNGASLTSADGSAWTIDTPQLVEALRFYQSFFAEGIANKAPSTDNGAQEAAFVDGSVPMLITGPYEVAALNAAGGAGFTDKYATAVLPKQQSATSFVGGANLVVFKQAKNPTAAWKLIRFLSEPRTQVEWYQMTGDLPAVQAAWDDQQMAGDAKLAVFGEQLKSVQAPPTFVQWAQVQAAADAQMEKITVTGADPADAVKQIQQQATAVGTGS